MRERSRLDDLTSNQFLGTGRIFVSTELRARIRLAYWAHEWPSSRHAAAATARAGERISHQTIESFLDARWTTTERRVLRALIAIHDLDPIELSRLVPSESDSEVEWTVTLPRRHWVLDNDRRDRAVRTFVRVLDLSLNLPESDDDDDDGDGPVLRHA